MYGISGTIERMVENVKTDMSLVEGRCNKEYFGKKIREKEYNQKKIKRRLFTSPTARVQLETTLVVM